MGKTEYERFLANHYSEKGQEHTHTRIGDASLSISGGVYTIEGNDLKKFHSLYHDYVFKQGRMEFLTEKQNSESGPIAVDFDFRYDTNVKDKQHNTTHINEMVGLYMEEVAKLVDIPVDTSVEVYIFEKENVNMLEHVTKDGIHMIIGVNMDRALQVILRDRILNKLNDIWRDLPLTNSWDEVIDEGIVKANTNWQLYGSRKPGCESYLLRQHYTLKKGETTEEDIGDFELNAVEWECTPNVVSKFKLSKNFTNLSVQSTSHPSFSMNKSIISEYETMKRNLQGKKQNKSSSLTKSRSKMKMMNTSAQDINILEDITGPDVLQEVVDRFLAGLENEKNASNNFELKEIHMYTMILPNSFYDPYDKWIRVGWALKNTNDKMFITWVAFSALSSKFDYDKIPEMFDMWNRFSENNDEGLTKRSIHYWAKTENPKEYHNILSTTVDHFVTESIKHPTDWDFAKVMHQLYKHHSACVSIKKDLWYKYVNHRWVEDESGNLLRSEISTSLHNIYLAKQLKIIELNNSGTVDVNSKEHTANNALGSKIGDICDSLRKRAVKDNIMREARELFYDQDFLNKIDDNPKLLGFENGVIDFSTKTFRHGQPDDYISKSTGIDYVKLDKKKHAEHISYIETFFSQLFPIKERRDYMWDHCASMLIGENKDQSFNIYNGVGRNGKSMLIKLLEYSLGSYKETVPISIITQKRNSVGSTSSEIVLLKGARLAVMQESSKGERLNEGVMKEITGGDPLQGRALYKDCITFIPQFKFVAMTNNLLNVGSNDDGTWRRICVVKFESKFCPKKEFEKGKPHQYEIDKSLSEKLKVWAPVFMSMLVERAYITNGLVEKCDDVMASSGKYRKSQDCFTQFAEDKVIALKGNFLTYEEVTQEFKAWYLLHYSRNNVPRGVELFEFIDNKFFPRKNGGWKNLAISSSEVGDDEDSEEEDIEDGIHDEEDNDSGPSFSSSSKMKSET
jgi:P4 family phage/plasmid primase-like protien